MRFSLFKLHFHGGVHVAAEGFGEESVSETISSDTLLSAVCTTASKLYGVNGAAPLLDPGAVHLSSAFPFLGDDLFFPRPLSHHQDVEDATARKTLKKVRFVAKPLFEEILKGELPAFNVTAVKHGCWNTRPFEERDYISTHQRSRVSLDRVTNASNMYHVAEIRFSHDAGLFFLASFGSNGAEKRFRTSLRLLADEGIGADRSVGVGLFRLTEDELAINAPEGAAETVVLLSLYNPSPEEREAIQPERSAYMLVSRRGWVTATGGMTLRRPLLRFFGEGSVLSYGRPTVLEGRLVDVLNPQDFPELPHSIYRSGRSLSLPIQLSHHELA